ncbi:beta-N-acetylhexosaminidase [Streptomyces sp. JV185]|uniref:beta-N-acetylhexosaminidase n=1 Tax=Streptomyces sp. JV185 TaxID=858638 RepID=UPI002E782289|nr:beta-N-acetylhexosaminidase [Streptomyces sp. JV185]MEE1770077.1 beta-N-acetylhexosaminidase [Streptomyces sp. JV185]
MTAPMMLPRPVTARPAPGEFPLDAATTISAPDALATTAAWLQSALRPATGLPLPVTGEESRPGISLTLRPELGAEAYRLESGPAGVRIEGGDASGVFYGCQVLLQLLPPRIYRSSRITDERWTVPGAVVEDVPHYRWRGTMLDVARHFLPKREVLRFIDLMAMHRLNTLHLHLTDDQGWRVEIRRFPGLTETGGWRGSSQLGSTDDDRTEGRPHGGYYTQDDIREIVAHAAERGITVVPEIDVPGHSQAAIAAYPELGVTGEQLPVMTRWGVSPHTLNTEESTIDFFREVLDEIMALFPGTFIGVGGDECPKDQWKADPRTQELMAERGLADENALQAWFIARIAAHVAERGRRVFGWDEILEGELPPGVVVASWRGMTGAVTAARRGFDVVSCPDDQVYLDYRQSEHPDEPIPVSVPVTLADAYSFDPVPDGLTDEQAARVLGGQANLWTEHMDTPRMVDYYAFPRLCAVAEALWRGPGHRDFEEFRTRLQDAHLPRLDAIGVEYRARTGPLPWQTRPGILGAPATRADREAHMNRRVAAIRS